MSYIAGYRTISSDIIKAIGDSYKSGTREANQILIALRRQGYTVSRSTVRKYLKKIKTNCDLGIEKPEPYKEEIIALSNQGKTRREIAGMLGISYRRACKLIKKYTGHVTKDEPDETNGFKDFIKILIERDRKGPQYEVKWERYRVPPEIETLVLELFDKWETRRTSKSIADELYSRTRNKISGCTVRKILERNSRDLEGLWNPKTHYMPYEQWEKQRKEQEGLETPEKEEPETPKPLETASESRLPGSDTKMLERIIREINSDMRGEDLLHEIMFSAPGELNETGVREYLKTRRLY